MTTSQTLHEKALDVLVGGVNSPVRAFGAVSGTPLYMTKGERAYLEDIDGKRYIDFVMSWGPHVLGHAPPQVVQAISEAAANSTSFGTVTQAETTLALALREQVPSMKKCRFVSSGTEATMSAIRLARGVTHKSKIVKFDGCYHGHSDALLVEPGSGSLSFGTSGSAGVLPEVVQHTLSLPFNDTQVLETAFKQVGRDIACVIVEPIVGNMGLLLPDPKFLDALRFLCTGYGALLIFDEVMTGFRCHLGGAQRLYDVIPDLTCLGKVIGGGLPCGAYGGKAEVMDALSPLGPVYQAGTLSGNPLAMAAGLAVMETLTTTDVFDKACAQTQWLRDELHAFVSHHNWPVLVQARGTMFHLFFHPGPVQNLTQAKESDTETYAKFFHALLGEGVYFPPSQFETCFTSTAHDSEVMGLALTKLQSALKTVFS